MRIRISWLPKLVGLVAGIVLPVWMRTLRYRYYIVDPTVDPNRPEYRGRYIYAFWHEMMLHPVYARRNHGIHMLVSRHGDGEYIAQVGKRMGFGTVRGSTNRGGVQAIRELMRQGKQFNLTITPDGPRGPRRQVQIGMIYVASRTGLPIVPIGFAFRRPWRINSWDRFAIPKPFSIATSVGGDPITVPKDLDRQGLERYRLKVQTAIAQATELAERWAESGRRNPDQVLLQQMGDEAIVATLSRTSL